MGVTEERDGGGEGGRFQGNAYVHFPLLRCSVRLIYQLADSHDLRTV